MSLDHLEDRTTPAVIDLTALGSTAQVGGVQFTHTPLSPVNLNPFEFLSFQVPGPGGGGGGAGIEEGYNTNASPSQYQFDSMKHAAAILLSTAPIVHMNGTDYREFILTTSESANAGHSYIVMNDLRLYAWDTAVGDSPFPYVEATGTLGGFSPVYDLDASGDNSITLDGGGGGKAQMAVLVPVSAFTGLDPASTYLFLYSKFGDNVSAGLPLDYVADDGQEEWSAYTTAQSPLADLAVTKTDSPDPAIPGSSLSYTITVTNNGPTTVNSVLLTDTVPSILTNVQFFPPPGTTFVPSQAGNTYSGLWSGFTLSPGGSISMTVTADIPSTAPAQVIQNTVTVATTGGTGDPDLSNNTDTEPTTLLPTGNLTVTKDDGVTSVVAGQDTVTYTMVITNSGPSTFTSIIFQDPIPAELESVTPFAVAGFPGAIYNPITQVLGGVVLSPGGSITVTFTGHVRASATGSLVNTVTVAPPPGAAGTGGTATDTDVINQLADVSITKTSEDLDLVFAGDSLFYYVTVLNNGPSSLTGIPLSDPFADANITSPVWTVFSSAGGATSSVNSGAGPINVTLNLPAASSITFRVAWTVNLAAMPTTVITNTAVVTVSPLIDPNQGDNTAIHTDTVIPPPIVFTDLQITKTHSPEPAVPGDAANPVLYTIVVSNPAGATQNPVIGATVTDTFLLNLAEYSSLNWTVVGTTGGAVSLGGTGTGPLMDTVNLPVDSSISYQVTGQVLANATGDIHNRVVVVAPAGVEDPDESNNVATDTVTLQPEVDLAITKDDGQTIAVPGTAVTYTITVTNNGPSTITSVDLDDTLPPELIPATVVFTPQAGTSYDPVTGLWSGFTLATGTTITMTLTGTIDPSATGTITNTATVTPIGAIEQTGPDTASDTDTLTPQADVAILKTNPVAPFFREIPGLTVTYTITVSNAGPSDATNVQVSDTFLSALSNITWTNMATGGASGNTASGTGDISDVVNVPVGATITYTVTGLIDPTTRGQLVNTATAFPPPGVDPNLSNNTSTHTDVLAPQADLAVAKTSNTAAPTLKDTLVYTITVTNLGPSTVDSYTLTETLPPQFAVISQVPSDGTYDPATGEWTGIILGTGQSVTLTITGTVTGGVGSNIVNTAVVAPPPGVNDVNLNNNGASLSLPVQAPAIVPPPPIPILPPIISKRALLTSSLATSDPLTGSMRAAVADFNQDGVPDTVYAAAPGAVDFVRVVDGRTGAILFFTEPFDPSFTGGVYVTTGDLTGDGIPDLVVTPDRGGGPRVQVYDGTSFALVHDFFGIDDADFRGGVRPAVGDFNGDGINDLGIAAGSGGGPRVTLWDGAALRAGALTAFANFFAFEPELRDGVFLAAGDVNRDGFEDLILGAGPGGAPRIRIFSGNAVTLGFLDPSTGAYGFPELADFFAGDTSERAGVRVAFWDADGDGIGEVLAGSGPGASPWLRSFETADILANPFATPPATDLSGLIGDFFLGAVFVG